MSQPISDQMQALLLEAHHDDVLEAVRSLKVVQRATPKPAHGQVLVKMDASPCNPSDLLFLQGKYGTGKTLPTVPGWEGAGTVVASGGGLLAWWLQGKRVACGNQDDRDGAWAQYMAANAAECIPLKQGLTLEQGATLIINPLTAVGLLATARKEGHAAAVQTAGASQVGRMVVRLAKEAGYPLISIVRRDAQVELLKREGAAHVLNSSNAGFVEQLTDTCAKLQATAAFEAVAGDMTGIVLNAMPRGATAYVYGSLSETACGGVEPLGLVFEEKQLRGFYLGGWLKQQGSLGILRAAGRVQRMVMKRQIGTHVERRVGLEGAAAALEHYVQHMTDGKVLIAPHG
ncbi:Alcohol dehydrogenase [Pirellulimonas nuda]|uniref:Alcohol dehydrogenase n=1 Tax=Pirellulimonas nuda TaxID=2528009 RepID=A0A518D904_9BACT|nr:zinc-binding dehydrogenase [Pirellulimonas nuda]QDU87934.1 Alcohol dehydrogenase [Pirellulimonas nuda]